MKDFNFQWRLLENFDLLGQNKLDTSIDINISIPIACL